MANKEAVIARYNHLLDIALWGELKPEETLEIKQLKKDLDKILREENAHKN